MPILIFLGLYLGSGVYFTYQGVANAFYHINPNVCIVPALVFGVLLGKHKPKHNLTSMIDGMRHPDIITMCLIFLLAGAFTQVTQALGCVDATVAVSMTLIPQEFLLLGVFMISAFISTAIGTSIGVIVLMGPIAFGLSQQGAFPAPLAMATVVGGAMFGDNLSLISDTTIAAVQSLGADYRKKFKLNAIIALSTGLITALVLIFSHTCCLTLENQPSSLWLIVPYGVILVAGLLGLNVFAVLLLGLASALGLGLAEDCLTLPSFAAHMAQGFTSMTDIMILSLGVGGISGLLRDQGATALVAEKLTRLVERKQGVKTAELLMAALSSIFDLMVANNTIAIILSGDIARTLAHRFKVLPHRAAYIVDTFSCVFQGILPYGAQVLLACKLANITPMDLITKVYYCYILAVVAVIEIFWTNRRR